MPDEKVEFNLDEFLKDFDLGDKGEVIKEVLSTEQNQKKLQGAVLRQSEFDKKMDASKAELQVKLDELGTKQKSLDELITKNIAYKGDVDKVVEKAVRERDAALAKATKAAKEAGYESLDEVDDDGYTPKVKEPVINVEELTKQLGTKFVTPDSLDRLATGHINLILEIDEVGDTYQELHGKRLSRTQKAELIKEFGKDFKDDQTVKIMDTADRLFKFGESRAKSEEERVKKLLEDARADERRKVAQEMSDQGLPAPRRTGTVAPIAFKSLKDGEKPSDDRRVRLALEAVNKQREAAAS